MLKILILTSLFPNKIKPDLGIFIKKRVFAYAQKRGYEIEVVAPVPYYPDLKPLRKFQYYSQVPLCETMNGIKVYHPRYPMIPKVSMPIHGRLMYFGIRNFIKKLYGKFNFDLIDAHFIYPDGQVGVLLGKLLDVPVIVSARGSDIHEYLTYPQIKNQIKKVLQRSDHVISVCEALKDMMVELGINERKISVVPNGIDNDQFYMTDRNKARNLLGIDTVKVVILSVGALIPLKGHDLTIQATAQIIKSWPNLKLYIIGSGPEESRLKSLVESLNLKSSVSFLGQIPNNELVTWYNASNLFCLSSLKEGWPNVLIEALACGTPVVATKVFGTPEIVQNDSMGLLVERDHECIAEGMTEALRKNWDRNEISEKISSRTWEVVADECSRLFTHVLDN